MNSSKDDIRPRGTVEVTCQKCDWCFWIDSLDPRLPSGPFICPTCDGKTYEKSPDQSVS